MSTTTTNTFIALQEAQAKLEIAKISHENITQRGTMMYNREYVEQRAKETSDAIQRWSEEISRMQAAEVHNFTPTVKAETVQSAKARRKAAKRAAKKQTIMRMAQVPVQKRRKFVFQHRLTRAEKTEMQRSRELEKFFNFVLKRGSAKALERMPSNQGMKIGGILFMGSAEPSGDLNRFSYTERERQADGEYKVYEYVTEPADDGYKRVTKYHNGVQISVEIRRTPGAQGTFGPAVRGFRQREYTVTEEDFPVLERAVVVPGSGKYRSWAAAAVRDTTPELVTEPTAPVTPTGQGTNQEIPSAPARVRRSGRAPERCSFAAAPGSAGSLSASDDSGEFTTVNTKRKSKSPASKIKLSPKMQSCMDNLPENVGRFVRGRIFWGKKSPSRRPDIKTATKLYTLRGKSGILRYTWSSSFYTEDFKEKNTPQWVVLRYDQNTNGDRIMSTYA